jgi:hypothetical protein
MSIFKYKIVIITTLFAVLATAEKKTYRTSKPTCASINP